MSANNATEKEYVIVHATDLRPDGQRTFDHAVTLAKRTGGKLISCHISEEDEEGAPDREEMLKRLSTPEEGLVHETLIKTDATNPRKELMKTVEEIGPDLLIVGSRRQAGEGSAMRKSVSEAAALDMAVPTLVVHIGQEGMVDGNGALRLRRVLLPVGDGAEARDTIEALTKFLDQVGQKEVDIYLLRVGDAEILDHLVLPERDGWRWHRQVKERGMVANVVAEQCELHGIDLIAMATRGKDGFVDVFSGTHTQKVIRRAPRPVLAVNSRSEI